MPLWWEGARYLELASGDASFERSACAPGARYVEPRGLDALGFPGLLRESLEVVRRLPWPWISHGWAGWQARPLPLPAGLEPSWLGVPPLRT